MPNNMDESQSSTSDTDSGNNQYIPVVSKVIIQLIFNNFC